MGKKKRGGGGGRGGSGGGAGVGGEYYYYMGGGGGHSNAYHAQQQHQHSGMADEVLFHHLMEELLRARWAHHGVHIDRRSWLQRVYARIRMILRDFVSALFPTRSEYEQRRPPPEYQERHGQSGAGGGHSDRKRVQEQEPEVSCFAVLGLEPTGEGVTEEAVKRAYR